MKKIGIFIALSAQGMLCAMNIKDINIPAIVEQIKVTVENTAQLSDLAGIVGRRLDALPYGVIGLSKDDIERLARGDLSQSLVQQLKSHFGVSDADLVALRQGRVPDELRARIAQESQRAIEILRRIAPQIRNIETVVELIKSPLLTKIVRPERLTPEFKKGTEQLIAYINENREAVAALKNKIAQIITVVIEMVRAELSAVQDIPTDVGSFVQRFSKITSAISPQIQAVVKEIQSLNTANNKAKLEEIFTTFKSTDFSKIDLEGIKKDLVEFRATLS